MTDCKVLAEINVTFCCQANCYIFLKTVELYYNNTINSTCLQKKKKTFFCLLYNLYNIHMILKKAQAKLIRHAKEHGHRITVIAVLLRSPALL